MFARLCALLDLNASAVHSVGHQRNYVLTWLSFACILMYLSRQMHSLTRWSPNSCFSIIVMDIFAMTVHSSAWCYCEWAKRPNLHLCVKFCDDHSNSCRDNSGFSQNGDHPPSWTSYACVWTTQEMYAAVFSFVRKLFRISCVVIKICEFWGYGSLAWKCLFMPLSGEFLWWNGEYGNC